MDPDEIGHNILAGLGLIIVLLALYCGISSLITGPKNSAEYKEQEITITEQPVYEGLPADVYKIKDGNVTCYL